MDFMEEELEELLENASVADSTEETNTTDEINENEPVPELDSSNSIPHEGDVENPKAQTKKKNLKKIVVIKVSIIIASIIGLALFIQILIHIFDFDIVGIGNTKPSYYFTTCDKVYFTWENESYTKARQKKEKDYVPISNASLVTDLDEVDPEYGERYTYKEYEYDTYISGVIWTDNDNALDIDNNVVYEAMAIAARSRLIAELPNTCVVLKNYNEQAQSFTELTGNEQKYEEITKAVQNTKGIIIGRKGKIISAKYDTFSYVSKRKEEDEAFNNAFFYHMMHESKEKQQYIPADWVEELEKKKGKKIPKEHVNSTKKLESMSLYGAKYLLEKVDSQYELYRILEEYYGRDIEYYTIDANASYNINYFGGSGCMWWPVGSSTTTEEDGITMAIGNPSAMKISSPFGYRNISLAGASTNHKAIDISGGGVDNFHNIIAAADGEVIAINTGCVAGDNSCGGSLGNYVKIQHKDGTVTRYGHLYSVSVSTGDEVKQGQVIGKMGNTGNSTGVHLDFQVLVNGTPVNPINYVSVSNPRPQCLVSSGTVAGNNNTQTICLTLKNNGYSDSGIAGVLGNLQAESGFNPSSVNSIGCSGIAQWCFERMVTLKTTYGDQWNTLDAQLNYMLNELNSGYSSVNAYIYGNHSPSDMAHYFCMHYEIPGESYCNSGVRQGYANNWLNYVSNGCN